MAIVKQESNEKLKVHVVSFTGDSGLTDYSVSLCRHLSRLADVTFVTGLNFDKHKYRADFNDEKIFRRTRYYPIDIFKFIYFILKSRPDIILFQSWLKYPILESFIAGLFRLNGIRLALTVHDLLPHVQRPWSRWELMWYYRRFDRLIVHSERTATGLLEMGVHTKPLVVPHGIYDIFKIDTLSRSQAIAEFPEIKPDDFVVLFFGHLDARKGILEFLESSELLTEKNNIKFLVAGARASHLSSTIMQKLDGCKGKYNIIIHDFSIPFDRVQYYFKAANAVALPYLEGTTSGVIKLAMAFDLPIIVTDIGDFSETLRDWPGLLIGKDDIASELAVAIEKMKDSYQEIMGTLSLASKKYQWDGIAAQHMSYFK